MKSGPLLIKEQACAVKRIIDDLFDRLTESAQVYLTKTTCRMSYLKAAVSLNLLVKMGRNLSKTESRKLNRANVSLVSV